VFRLAIFALKNEEKIFVFSTHHLNADLFSLVNLLEELFFLYELQDPSQHNLPPIERTFGDYVRWQTELLAGPEGAKLWAYWSEKFRSPLPKLELPLDKPRPAVQTNNGSTFIFKLDRKLSQKLKSMAKQEGSTPFMALLSVYYVLLFQLSKQNDIIVGTPVPGRRGDPRFERVLGTFVNVLALRVNLDGAPSFREVLGRVSATVRDARTHQEFPFPLLVEKLRPARDTSRAPIFQAYFTLQKLGNHQDWLSFFTPIKQDLELEVAGLKLAPVEITQQEGQMELSVHVYDFNDDLYPEFKYNTDIFEISTIKKMAQSYTEILQLVVDDPSVLISRLTRNAVLPRAVELVRRGCRSFERQRPRLSHQTHCRCPSWRRRCWHSRLSARAVPGWVVLAGLWAPRPSL